jgi:hypothetical protein
VTSLLENPPKKLSIINLMLCYSLFTLTYDEFLKHKPSFLKWITTAKPD